MLEPYDIRKKLELGLVVLLILVACFYGATKAYPLIAGPSVVIYSPQDGETVASSTFELSGKAKRVKEIRVQGRPIPIDTDGHFVELLVAMEPYTILTITATDFYGKTVIKTLRVTPR